MAKRQQDTAVPIVCLLVVAFLAAVVIPSALRPPPDQANNSAALSPDAPPDDSEPDAIISSFQQAGSSTAGAAKASEPTDGPGATTTTLPPPPPPPQQLPSRGLCFGTPPTQTESIYAPACEPAFVGDNGGSTYLNVTADEVRLGVFHTLGMPPDGGPVPTEPPEDGDENAAARTLRVLQTYFTQRYETYGRRIQIVAIDQDSREPADEKIAAARAAEEYKIFMTGHLDRAFCEEIVRRDLICYGQNPYQDATYDDNAPYWWGLQMRASQNDKLSAEYVCKRLVGNPAAFAGQEFKPQERKIGLLYEVGRNDRSYRDLEAELSRQCGYVPVQGYDVRDPAGDSNEAVALVTAMAQMRQEGVTTIVFSMELGSALIAMQQADSSGYQPEWVHFGAYGLDQNTIASLLPASQRTHLFGMSGFELARPNRETECFRAYKTIDPDNNPDLFACTVHWLVLQQMVIAIQKAGPDLTPQTIQQGFFDYGYVDITATYGIEGGYGPGDLSWVDKMGEVWYDSAAQDPQNGTPGAYRWTDGAKRYGIGEIPEGQPDLFGTNGITRPDG